MATEILIIDDNAEIRNILDEILSDNLFENSLIIFSSDNGV